MARSNRTRRPIEGTDDSLVDVEEPDERTGLRAALRRPRPAGTGPRVAYAYLVAMLVGLLVVPVLSWLGRAYSGGAVCRGNDSLECVLAWLAGTMLVAVGVLLALGAWFFRLGWRWAVATVVLVGLLLVVAVPLGPAVLLLLVSVPAVAALLADVDLPRRRERTVGIAALAVGAVGGFLWLLLG